MGGSALVFLLVPTHAPFTVAMTQIAAMLFLLLGAYAVVTPRAGKQPKAVEALSRAAGEGMPLKGRWMRAFLTGVAVIGFLGCYLTILTSFVVASEWMFIGSMVAVVLLAGVIAS